MNHRLTAIIERESDGYVSLCPELDIASQGDSVERPGKQRLGQVDRHGIVRIDAKAAVIRQQAVVKQRRVLYRGRR